MDNNEENKVTTPEQPQTPPQPQQVQVASPTPAVSTNENMKMEPVVEGGEEQKPKKKSKKGLIVVIILLLLIAGGTSALVFLMPKNTVKKAESDVKEVHSKYRMTGNDIQNFDLYFMKLENNKQNSVYSPLSIKYALEMLSEGANGKTKAELDAVIGDYVAKKYDNNEHMSFANAMFIRDSYKNNIKEEYTKKLTEKYNAELKLDPFASPNNINNWVSEKTFKLINNLVDDVSDNDFFLINALAIDMNWNYRIQPAMTGNSNIKNMDYSVSYVHEDFNDFVSVITSDQEFPALKFNGIDNIKSAEVAATFNHYDIIKDKGEESIRSTVKTEYEKYLKEHPEEVSECPSTDAYLNKYIEEIKTNYKKADQSTDFYINDTEDVKVFGKDLQTYNGKTLQYVGIMPKEKDLDAYIKDIDAKSIQTLIKNMKVVEYDSFEDGVVTHIKGNIPFFKFENELKLVDDLNKLGIKKVFEEDADLSNMTKGNASINKAIHKANIDFNNEGIKAGAATAVGGLGATAGGCQFDYSFKVPIKEIDITFDKPYLFLVRDKNSGEVWFTGTVYEPVKK